MTLYVMLTFWMGLLLFYASFVFPKYREVELEGDFYPWSLKKHKNMTLSLGICGVGFLILWILTSERSVNIGNDTKVYLYFFDRLATEGIIDYLDFEIGFQYLNIAIGKVTRDPQSFLRIMAALMYVPVIIYVLKNSENPLISLVLFFASFLSVYMSMIRQGIAMGISLYIYQMIKENKKVLPILLILLTMTIHSTAAVMFLLFIDIRWIRSRMNVVVSILGISFLSATRLLDKLLIVLFPRYVHYLDGQYASSGWLAVTYSLILCLIWYFLSIESLVGVSEDECKCSKKPLQVIVLLLLFSGLGYSVNLFTRAGQYFLLIGIVEFPNFMWRGNLKSKRIWLFFIGLGMLIMLIVILNYRPEWNRIYPYETWGGNIYYE